MPLTRRANAGIAVIFAALATVAPAAGAEPVSDLVVAGHLTAFNEERWRAGTESAWRADAGETRVALQQENDELLVSALDLETTASVRLAPPAGEPLHTGLYTGAQRAAFRDPGRPGIDVSGLGGCEVESGRFDVKQLARDGTGLVRRLWATFELRCGFRLDPLIGEVLVDTRAGAAPPPASPAHVWWPDANVGQPGVPVPVAFHNRTAGPVLAGAASIGGRNRGDFAVLEDGCEGTTLDPGTHCQVTVTFTPGAGPRVAALRVPLGGRTVKVALDGFGAGGRTEVRIVSEEGDPAGAGGTYTYTPATALINARRGGDVVVLEVLSGAERWTGQFSPPLGQPLATGFYGNAQRFPPSETQPGLRVTRGISCSLQGFFNVSSLGAAADGSLSHFGVTFEQRCNLASGALRGEMLWRVPHGDVTPPAPVTDLTATRTGRFLGITWQRPFDSDYAATLVRYLYGTTEPGAPNAGRLAHAGRATSATIAVSPQPVAIAAYAVDSSGNVSAPATLSVPGA